MRNNERRCKDTTKQYINSSVISTQPSEHQSTTLSTKGLMASNLKQRPLATSLLDFDVIERSSKKTFP
jgi:hypothetical protein